MNVRKRGLALLMCICMIFTLLPFSALAEGTQPFTVTEENSVRGAEMRKTVTQDSSNPDKYTVTLEQWATGTVSTKQKPLDIVLVLDVSGSMDEKFGSGNTKKIASLKKAVNSFIDSIASKATDEVTHKIAIVKFAGDKTNKIGNDMYTEGWLVKKTYNHTQIVKSLTLVKDNTAGLKNAVNALSPAGATAADWGLEKAKGAFGSETADPNRQRVVIMFTDGEPNHDNGFDNGVANAAIRNANSLKNNYSSLVYTIGIFSGANVSDMDGKTNRYMNLISSNYPNATDLSTYGTGSNQGYYKKADNANELQSAFDNISTSIGQSGSSLDSTAVLTDEVEPNFTAPANADVKVYTADYDGNKFADREAWTNITSSVTVDVTDQNVTVSGFDYSANFVSNTPKSDGTHGKKLIVEFTIEVDRTNTYGGTQPTNAGANIKLGDETIIKVANPQVPVAITNGFSASYSDKKVYSGTGFDVKDAFAKMLAATNETTNKPNGLTTDGNMNDYVNIAYEVEFNGNVVGTYTVEVGQKTGTWNNDLAIMTSPDVGTYTYNVTCKVTDANGSAAYKTGVVDGTGTMTLTITLRTGLTVEGTGYNGVYNGQEHGTAAVAKIDGNTVTDTDGVTISYKVVGNGEWTTDVPKVKDVADSTTVQVKAEKAGYETATNEYTLTVTPRNVTLTSESATKAYDGTPLTRPDVTIGGDGFVAGEVTNIKATGTVTDVTTTPVTNTIVYDTTNNFKVANYNITKNEGTLTIYKAGDALATIQATKNFDGNPATTPSQFSFVLEGIEGKDTGKSFSGTNDANGKIVISRAYSEEGTYKYKLSEVKGTDTGIVYDGTAYYVQVVVKLNEQTQKYEAEVSYFADADCKEQIAKDTPTFNNTTAPGSLTISKTVSGNAADKNKEFTFTLTLSKNGEIMPGEVKYGGFTFKDGKYTFKLKNGGDEIFTGLPVGTTYTITESDNNGYIVSATVDGKTATLTNNMLGGTIAAGAETKVVFKNTKNYVYPPNPPIMDEIIVEITGNSDSVVYDGTEHSVKGYTVKISDPRYTEADFTFTGKAEASGVNAGTYEMGLKAEQFKNTNARFTNVKFVIKADGVLTITPKELIITAGSKTEYGPTPVTCDEWTVSGLAAGDKVESVKITGIQSVPGSSPNVPSDAVIKNAKGEDVTKNYAIKYVNGTLTMLEVLNKEDHFNYIIGTPEGLSLPTANVTRAEVATIFFRLMTDDARAKFDSLDNSFSDVAKGKWYNRAISTLANAGIIKGDPAGTYRPGDPITRAEMAAIIARFGDFKEGGKTFNDISGHWAQKYIELAASNGWINGNPDGTFKPNNNITRAETVAMINRVLDRQTKDVSDLLPVAQMTNWSDNMDTAKWYYRDMQEATNNHKAERVGNSIYEKWTEKLPDIDWASYQI